MSRTLHVRRRWDQGTSASPYVLIGLIVGVPSERTHPTYFSARGRVLPNESPHTTETEPEVCFIDMEACQARNLYGNVIQSKVSNSLQTIGFSFRLLSQITTWHTCILTKPQLFPHTASLITCGELKPSAPIAYYPDISGMCHAFSWMGEQLYYRKQSPRIFTLSPTQRLVFYIELLFL